MFISKKMSRIIATMCAVILTMGSLYAQNLNVTGKVTDQNGDAIVGAYVLVEGTRTGASTNLDGVFSISAPAKGNLLFSCMGYKDLKAPVNGRAVINVILEEDAEMLQDAVVVGFGTQKKENLTGAVAAIDASKTLSSRPIADIGRGLQGVTPGLNILIGSTEVGSDPVIRIRGQVGSYKGESAPLILLDNVEIPSIQMVNPDDIASISVLKDAASSSIYGAKAAFGVILINSKKGSKTDKITVSYSANLSFQSMAKDYEMGGVDALHYTVEAHERVGTTTPVGAFWKIDRASWNAAVAWQNKYGDKLDPYDPMTYGRDWWVDESDRKIGVRTYDPYTYLVRDHAPTQTHNLSVSGKSGKTTYNISLGYLDQNGMMKTAKHDDFRRWNANVRVNSQIKDFLNIHAGLMYSKTQKRWAFATNSTTADIWYYTYRWGPTFPLVPYDEYGNGIGKNPVWETANSNTANITKAYSSVNLGATITPLGNWDITLDYTYAENQTSELQPGTSFYAGYAWGTPVDYKDESGKIPSVANDWNDYNGMGNLIPAKALDVYRYTGTGSNPDLIYRDSYVSRRQTFNATSYYDMTFGGHHIKPMVGVNSVAYEYEGNWSKMTGLMDYNNPQFSLATGTQTSGGDYTWSSTLGFFGRVNYDYKGKYLLEGNVRYDGSSKFPSDLKWRWFYSASAGWRVTDEPWMENTKEWLNSLKIRGSFGKIGDQTVKSSLYIPTMNRTNSYWIHNGAIDVYYTTPAAVASDITWQDIVTLDFGFDATFLDDFSMTADWYQRDTKNMIVGAEGISYNFGTDAPLGNYGNLRTRGYEIELNYGHVFDNGLSLSVNATFADAKTTITKYGSGRTITGWYNGKTYGEIWGYRVDRLFQNEDFVFESGKLVKDKSTDGYTIYKFTDGTMPTQGYLNSGNLIFGPGDVKYKDLDGNGVINQGKNTVEDHGDKEVIGNTTPRYEYGFRVDLAWKEFDFSMFWQGIGKRDMWGSSSVTLAGYNAADGAMAQTFAGDFWYETFDNGTLIDSDYDAFYPRAATMGNGSVFNMNCNDRYLLNMAYLRLKNVTLGYTLPQKISRKAFIDKLRIYISLENFLTFDHLNGLPIDPEVINGYSVLNSTNYNSSRVGVGAPAFKSASIGLQLTF